MEPKLPPNPGTISRPPPSADTWTPADIEKRYAGAKFDRGTFEQIRKDLAELRAWDDYERSTSATREVAKDALRRLLRREP